MIDRSIDQRNTDNRCLFKRARDRLTNELRKLIWTKPSRDKSVLSLPLLLLHTAPLPLLLFLFSFFFFFLQTPLPLVITHPRGRLLNLSPLVNSSLPPPSIPTFNPERPHSCGKIIVATRLTIRSYIFYYFSTWKKIQANLFFSLSLFLSLQLSLFNSSAEIVLEPITYNLLPSFLSFHLRSPHRRVIEKLVVFSRIMPLTRSNGACTSHDGSIYRYQRLHPNPGLPLLEERRTPVSRSIQT